MTAVVVYLGLGANLGDRHGSLKRALALLSEKIQIGKVSSVYETEPVGNINQPKFLNMVCQARTALTPEALLSLAKGIESRMGRRPAKERWGPRPIDIDILFYGDKVVETPELVIPHPRLMERAFVLVPLAEIVPDLMHPIVGKTVRQLLEEVGGKEGVVRWEE